LESYINTQPIGLGHRDEMSIGVTPIEPRNKQRLRATTNQAKLEKEFKYFLFLQGCVRIRILVTMELDNQLQLGITVTSSHYIAKSNQGVLLLIGSCVVFPHRGGC
jgi:hypothetical protein